jgi:hypothetical protein
VNISQKITDRQINSALKKLINCSELKIEIENIKFKSLADTK